MLQGARIFKNHPFPILLVAITLVISAANYTPGTWLTGWDTLHPEFDFVLNIKRTLFGVWRAEQGLGAVAIHSHMADLPRILLLWLFSPLLPDSFLRYAYFFLCLIVGPLGVYYFLDKAVFHRLTNNSHKSSHHYYGVAAFLGALFYLLNLGTMQHFYVPFEMFTTQYAFVGWLFLFATKIFYKPTRRNFLLFFILLLFASPMAYAATLFYAFFLCMMVYLGGLLFSHRTHMAHASKRTILILVTILVANSYWLLPNIYTVLFHSREVAQSKINLLFSEEAFLHNKVAGTLPDVLRLKGFLFNWSEYKGNGTFDFLLDEWRSFTTNHFILIIQVLIVLVIITGVFVVVKKRQPILLGVFGVAMVSIIFLMNANPPFGLLFNFLRDLVPLFREALRTPYTKFSILLAFCFAVFFSLGFLFILQAAMKRFRKRQIPVLFSFLVGILLIVSMLPVFKGGLISPSMRVAIPDEYFALNEWFRAQPNKGKIAHLPMPTFWAWTYYDWGYQGAGFAWFGIPQPLLDRDFDRWSKFNGQYYREMSHALYAQDLVLFEALLEKYQVRYLLYDDHVIVPNKAKDKTALFPDEIKGFISKSNKVSLEKRFGEKLSVYKVPLTKDSTGKQAFTPVTPSMLYEPVDYAYKQHGNYFSLEDSNDTSDKGYDSIVYLLRSFIGQGEQLNSKVITVKGNNYTVALTVPRENGSLVLSDYMKAESFLPADIYAQKSPGGITLKAVYGLPWPQGHERPNSLVTLALASLPQDVLLSINQTQPLQIPKTLSSDLTYIGRVTLQTQANNTFTVFTPSVQEKELIDITTIPLAPELCSRQDERQVYGLNKLQGGNVLALYGQNAVSCVSIPINAQTAKSRSTTNQPVLMQFDFDYELINAATPYYCLYDVQVEQCVYTSYGNRLQLITSPNHFTDTVAVPANVLNRYQIRLFLDTVNSQEVLQLNYTNLTLAFTKPTTSTVLDTPTMAQALSPRQFTVATKGSLALTGFFPEQGRNTIADVTRMRRRPETCSGLVPTLYNREIIVEENTRAIQYTAENGTSCDHFGYLALPHDRAHLIAINARHDQGLPLKVCVSNSFTKRCELFTQLDSADKYKNYYLLLPSSTTPIKGYDINIDNVSIGNLRSINSIRSISVLPFPANWFGNLKVTPPTVRKVNAVIPNEASGLPFVQKASVGTRYGEKPLVVLSQAYEPGWKLIQFLGPIPMPVKATHVLVNNWANGYILENARTEGNLKNYYAIFIPQFLQFFGFLALVVYAVNLVRKETR